MRNAILKLLCEQLPRESKLAVLAGHYALFHDDSSKKLVPGIYSELPDGALKQNLRVNPYAGVFAQETLYFGRDLLKAATFGQVLCLANDLRWVRKQEASRLEYFRNGELPDLFTSALSKLAPLNEIMVPVPLYLQVEGNKYIWSEQQLMQSYDSPEFSSCSVDNGCAQEFLPLLLELEKIGYRDFVALIPPSCKAPTIDATQEAKRKLELRLNIYTLYLYNTLEPKNFWDEVEVYKDGELLS